MCPVPCPKVIYAANGTMTFYATAAQVIPLLFLVLVFEARYFDNPPSDYAGLVLIRLVLLVYMLVGEWCAFAVLFTGHPQSFAVVPVVIALSFAGSGVFVQPIWRQI